MVNCEFVYRFTGFFGGVLTFIVASLRYWEFAKDWLHLLILGLALGGLIWLGLKKFKDYK
jgi:hypothetical protein